MNKKLNSLAITYCAICIALNVVLGTAASMFKLPVFLDTIGTIFSGAVLGPFFGALVGLLTNLINSFTTSVRDIPFALVNIAVGIIVGLIAKKWGFKLIPSIITGIILAIVAPLIATPIIVGVYGGITGSGADLLTAWFKQSGKDIFSAVLIGRITSNLVDKIGSAVLVSVLIQALPKSLINKAKGISI